MVSRVSDEDLIQDVRRVFDEIGRPPKTKEYTENGHYHCTTAQRRFDSWSDFLRSAGVPTDGIREGGVIYSDEDIFSSLQQFFIEYNTTSVSVYEESGLKPCPELIRRRFNSWQSAFSEAGLDVESSECPFHECEGLYSNLGKHWRHHPEHRPEITERQHEILTGLQMGDGSLYRNSQNPHMVCVMTTPEFLEWLDDEMGILGYGVFSFESMSSESIAERMGEDTLPEDVSDAHYWHSVCHPELERYDWYGTGMKRYPKNLSLTPLILKTWFCGDGSRDGNRLSISCGNESDRTEYLTELFSDIQVSPQFNLSIREDGRECLEISFGVDDSECLWEYMEEPLPGFEYKWV